MEIWKDIPDWEDYYSVSNMGRVYSIPRIIEQTNGKQVRIRGRIRKLRKNSCANGWYVSLKSTKRNATHSVGYLMLSAFYGIPEPGYIAHLKKGRDPFKLESYEWISENQYHEMLKIQALKQRKLSPETVRAIRSAKGTNRKIGEQFDIPHNQVFYIKTRIHYGDID